MWEAEASRTDAIVFMCLSSGKWTGLGGILSSYDAIDKSCPSADSLNRALGSLLGTGLAETKGQRFRLTDKGRTLIKESEAAGETVFDQADFLSARLNWAPPPTDYLPFTQSEVDRAARLYTALFTAAIILGIPLLILYLPLRAVWELVKRLKEGKRSKG